MRRKQTSSFRDSLNVWPGFTDVVVGLLLVFIFVVTLFTITQAVLSVSLSKKDVALHKLESELNLKMDEIRKLIEQVTSLENLFHTESIQKTDLEKALAAKTRDLDDTLTTLKTRDADLQDKERLLAAKLQEIEGLQSLVDERTQALAQREQDITVNKTQLQATLDQLAQTTDELKQKQKTADEMGAAMGEVKSALEQAKSDLASKIAAIGELKARIEQMNDNMTSLNSRMAGYLTEIDKLNKMLVDAKTTENTEKTRVAGLNKEIVSLRSKLDDISSRLEEVKAEKEHAFKVTQLVDLLGKKDVEIERLRTLAKYRSEFFARLETVFSGVGDIKVQGDRFVFQSEILFGSGRTDINESGKEELDKFAAIYRDMIPRIPPNLDLIILVQGHTDTDPVRSARYASNWELSAARAMQVVRYLAQKGIPFSRLAAAAFSEFHPVTDEVGPEGKRLNRRIEIKITSL